MAKPQIYAAHLASGVLETEAPEQKVKQMIRTGSLFSVLSVYCGHACTSVCVYVRVCMCVCWVEEESVCGEGVGVKSFKLKKKNLAAINCQYFPPCGNNRLYPIWKHSLPKQKANLVPTMRNHPVDTSLTCLSYCATVYRQKNLNIFSNSAI